MESYKLLLVNDMHGLQVLMEMGSPYTEMEIASFMSCSKGYMGECGIRGGYAEVVNMDPGVMAMLQKSISAKLCPTVLGQACMDLVVNPPRPGEPSYASWLQQKGDLFNIYTHCVQRKLCALLFKFVCVISIQWSRQTQLDIY